MTNAVQAMAALGDPTRREIFERLAEAPSSVGALAARLPVSRPAVSQHLRVLKEAGLVSETHGGKVLAWDPPGRVLLAWQIDARWTYNPGLVTEVEMTFVDQGDGTTLVK